MRSVASVLPVARRAAAPLRSGGRPRGFFPGARAWRRCLPAFAFALFAAVLAGSAQASEPVSGPTTGQLAGGGYHSLAVDSHGRVWSWGENAHGQLGRGDKINSPLPAEARIPEGVQFLRVAAGEDHSLALDREGRVWACGRDTHGELGGKGSEIQNMLQVIPGLPPATAIAAGQTHSLALTKAGAVWTWGAGRKPAGGAVAASLRPVQVEGLPPVVALCAGAYHDLALDKDGRVWSWGSNDSGQLGRNSRNKEMQPGPVEGLPRDIVMIAAGETHSLALQSDGTVWAWGGNRHGQLGDGGSRSQAVPHRVPGLAPIRQIACGAMHSVALSPP